MALSYAEAVDKLTVEAQNQGAVYREQYEMCSILKASGRMAKDAVRSPETTPKFDTSAMDGYALNSELTANATAESPVIFLVKGMIAAGDEPIPAFGDAGLDGVYPCVEIMTGARFPETFDCCVRIEDTVSFSDESSDRCYIKVMRPAKPRQHRRLAGSDFKEGDVIISAGAVISPAHIMAMASVGVTEVEVLRKPRIGVFSTGSEMQPAEATKPNLHRIRDANGPHIMATLSDWGVDADFLEVLDDNADSMVKKLLYHITEPKYDIIISTGAVSTGRFDTVPTSLKRLNTRVVFHRIAVKPGHPALFGIIPRQGDRCSGSNGIAYFGLPGNPVAAAACLRFLVNPFIKIFQDQQLEVPLRARVRSEEIEKTDIIASSENCAQLLSTFPPDKDVFRPGISHRLSDGEMGVTLIQDHSPSKVKPFAASNCWIHIHRGHTELRAGDMVDVFLN
ncbi:biosynthesis protein [Aspergillus sclerotialis]|uniref:molybdopterin adenylyltransferase n=1 Tax=Aspergillus sclerotialis TaxID=2070753 RepID=A0A3A2ZKN0_9EURO|nr:biosynthesis protein [Aspergillus sclerotialis]